MSNIYKKSECQPGTIDAEILANEQKYQKILFKFATRGSLSAMQEFCDLLPSDNSENSIFISKLRDTRGRTLLHWAAKAGNLEMIRFLIDSGVPCNPVDNKGCNAPLLFLKSCIKTTRNSKHRKRRCNVKKSYIECCEILNEVSRGDTTMLTTPNKKGEKPTTLLQQLWDEASEEERRQGDEILTSSMYRHAQTSSYFAPSYTHELESELQPEDESHSPHVGVDDDTSYCWEEYFSDFVYEIPVSHLDSIRREYEHRQHSHPTIHEQKQPNAAMPKSDPTKSFHAKHLEALSRRSFCSTRPSRTYASYKMEWEDFLKQIHTISTVGSIPWPPFCQKIQSSSHDSSAHLRIEAVLTFVNSSVRDLRQLQIDWHPDRFSSRLASRLITDIEPTVLRQVNAISQLLNTSMDVLRQRLNHD